MSLLVLLAGAEEPPGSGELQPGLFLLSLTGPGGGELPPSTGAAQPGLLAFMLGASAPAEGEEYTGTGDEDISGVADAATWVQTGYGRTGAEALDPITDSASRTILPNPSAWAYVYENIGVYLAPDSDGIAYVWSNVGVPINVSDPDATGYVYENIIRLFAVTGGETLATPGDSATAHHVLAVRSIEDSVPEPGDAANGIVGAVRELVEALPAISDSADETHVIAPRAMVENVPEPTDAAVAVVRNLHVRFGVEVLPLVTDQAKALTRLAAYSQPVSARPVIKRVTYPVFRAGDLRGTRWSSDGPVSQPEPYSERMPVLVDFGGFGFTAGGITVNVSEADIEAHFAPHFTPQGAS